MINVMILYGRPIESDAFDTYFTDIHQPLLLGIPNVEQMATNFVAGAAQGEPPYYLIVELQFDSEDAKQEGLNSEMGQAMARDLSQFASGEATILFTHATKQMLKANSNANS